MKLRIADKVLTNCRGYRRSTIAAAQKRVRKCIAKYGYAEGDQCPDCGRRGLMFDGGSHDSLSDPGDRPAIYCMCGWATEANIDWQRIYG